MGAFLAGVVLIAFGACLVLVALQALAGSRRRWGSRSTAPSSSRGGGAGGGRRDLGPGPLQPPREHPTPVAIMEALEWIGLPVSPVQMVSVFGNELEVNHVAYYFRTLAKLRYGLCVSTRPVRGSTEHFYMAADLVMVERAPGSVR